MTPWGRSTHCESPLPRMAGRRRLITMARRRHTPEQIIRKLREADRLLGEGADVAEVARHLEVSEQTYHRASRRSRRWGDSQRQRRHRSRWMKSGWVGQ